MRKLWFLIFLSAAVVPMHAAQQVTVEQLEQTLAAAHGKHDQGLANQLGDLELSERLSSPRLAKLQAGLPGEKSQLALLALADASAFLQLPAAEIPATAPPDVDTQILILTRAVDNLAATIHKLPNFFARQSTNRFHDLESAHLSFSGVPEPVVIEKHVFQPVDSFREIIHYRNGMEEIETDEKRPNAEAPLSKGLVNWGVFGPVLGLVLKDIYVGKIKWSHWEERASGRVAVFNYSIPKEKSDYVVKYCCVGLPGEDWHAFVSTPPFHGEIAIDPATGTIYRLVLVTELLPTDPIVRAEIVVEYEQVEIGSKMYICPYKSIAISKSIAPIVFGGCLNHDCSSAFVGKPKDTWIKDTVYDSYHLFRSESRILPAGDTGLGDLPRSGSSSTTPSAASVP